MGSLRHKPKIADLFIDDSVFKLDAYDFYLFSFETTNLK